MLVYDFWQIIECNVKNICVDNHCCYRFDNFIIQVVVICLTVYNKIIRGKYVNQIALKLSAESNHDYSNCILLKMYKICIYVK